MKLDHQLARRRGRARRPRDARALAPGGGRTRRRSRRCGSRSCSTAPARWPATKLAVAQRCAAWLVSRLRPVDELALVSYDDEVRLLAPLAPVREAPLRAAIAGLRPGGSTNLSGGWLQGLEQLRGAAAAKILLLTDGLANVGITGRGRARGARAAPAPARESARRRSASAPTSTRSCSRRWPTRAAATRTAPRRPTRRPRSSRASSRG